VEEVIHRDPQEGSDDRRVDPCEKDRGVRDRREAVAPSLRVIEKDREQQSEDELPDDRRPDDEDDRIEDDRGEVGIAEKALVVLQSDEARPRRIQADERLVREAGLEGPDRGTDEEQGEEERGRREAREIGTVPAERDGRGRRAGAQRPRSDRCAYCVMTLSAPMACLRSSA
jgi:hypothetical protein